MKITRENYEMFYLDLLEGNISNEDKLLLNEFLAANPDLIEDEDLVFLESSDDQYSDKSNLLQFDVITDEINLNNIEYFLIAEKEGLLNNKKQAELNLFISKNNELLNDKKYYQLSTLQSDSSVVYSEKKSLLQKEKVVLWPWISGVGVAASILLFMQLNTTIATPNVSYAQKELKIELEDSLPYFDNKTNYNISSNRNSNQLVAKEKIEINTPKKLDNPRNIDFSVQDGERIVLANAANPELNKMQRAELPVLLDYNFDSDENTVAALSPSEMNNPLKPVTDVIGKITGADVDYGIDKQAESGNKFYLKIGKLEILRKS